MLPPKGKGFVRVRLPRAALEASYKRPGGACDEEKSIGWYHVSQKKIVLAQGEGEVVHPLQYCKMCKVSSGQCPMELHAAAAVMQKLEHTYT